jgi:hypothetical protein
MMDSVGHYARPELLSLLVNDKQAAYSQSLNSHVDPFTNLQTSVEENENAINRDSDPTSNN